MDDMKPSVFAENLKSKYLSFVLTSVCRDNEKLYKELSKVFLYNEILWKGPIEYPMPKYAKSSLSDILLSGFSKAFGDFIRDFYEENGYSPYRHQISAWKKINNGENCVISTGTGSGKTECFFYPIINSILESKEKCLQSVIIYPLKALSKDQGDRIGFLLDNINSKFGTSIKWAIFDGDTGRRESSGRKSEVCTKEEIIANPPEILLTNYAMLERMILNPNYTKIFDNSKVKFVILDEIHYYRGSQGIDVSLLIRRFQFHLSRIKNVEKMIYIGTSATLSKDRSKNVLDFLFKIFNTRFKEDNLVYSEHEKLDPNDVDVRSHVFFRAPIPLYRCLECNKIHLKDVEKCDSCGSTMVFEIFTCRQCGSEFFNFNFQINPNNRSDVTFDTLDIMPLVKSIGEPELEERSILFSSNKYKQSFREVNLCKKCSCIFSASLGKCPKCSSKNILKIYSVEKKDKKINFSKDDNRSYCPKCEFEGSKIKPLESISKLSDENCSHVVFDESFMILPNESRKILLFTDNVQRASKFAREIEETHLKNLTRSELHRIIEKIDSSEYLSDVVHKVISSVKRKATVDEELELKLKQEIYEELLSKGKKVGSLANRGIFNLQIDLPKELNVKGKEIEVVFNILKGEEQLLSYYQIVNRFGFQNKNFLDQQELLTKFHRKLHHLEKKRIEKKVDLSHERSLLELMLKNNLLQRYEDKPFFNEEFIKVIKGSPNMKMKNYYDEWKTIENIPIIRSEVDTGKTNSDKRNKIEREFKDNSGCVNFLVATPTLELGIDIGDLYLVGMLYSPPTPAQYIQRSGRAGRKGKNNITVTFLSRSTLDSIHFHDPLELISGKITPPSFNIGLEMPIKKSLFSLFLYFILNKTNFEKNEGKFWYRINNWNKEKFVKISEYWRGKKSDFNEFLSEYFASSGIANPREDLVEEWIKKLDNFIYLNDKLSYEDLDRDIFNYFQAAGLLPDYAFGRAGSMVLPWKMNPILGFELKQACPPSTLDHDKLRFSCDSIDLKKARELCKSPKFCNSCKKYVSILGNSFTCPICSSKLVDYGHGIIEPGLIFARRSTFSLKQKRIKWNYVLADSLEKIILQNKHIYISKPFICDICMLFDSVIVDGESVNYDICDRCGGVYSSSDTRRKQDGHVHNKSNMIIGSKFKTKAILFNLKNLSSDSITLKNALIAAATIESGCEDGEIDGIDIKNTSKLILFDSVEGGVGFVEVFSDRLEDVIKRAIKLCEQECCEDGCHCCISSFWRQNEMNYLKKREIIPVLKKMLN